MRKAQVKPQVGRRPFFATGRSFYLATYRRAKPQRHCGPGFVSHMCNAWHLINPARSNRALGPQNKEQHATQVMRKNNTRNGGAKSLTIQPYEEVSKSAAEYSSIPRAKSIPVSDPIIRANVLEYPIGLGPSSASDGWLRRF